MTENDLTRFTVVVFNYNFGCIILAKPIKLDVGVDVAVTRQTIYAVNNTT